LSIIKYYRKFIEKSRLFCAKYFSVRRIDFILLAVSVAVFAVLFVKLASNKTVSRVRTDIVMSPRYEELFGGDVFGSLVREFEAQNPGIRILTASGGETAAAEDIVFFDGGEFRRLSGDLSLISLAPYINTGEEGEPLALPLVFFMDMFFYNIDVLKAADCDRPPKTRADFLATARAVAKENAFPLALGFGQEASAPLTAGKIPGQALRRDLYPWIWADSANIYTVSADGKPALSRAAVNVIGFFEQLNREGLLAPGTFEKTDRQRLREFAEGKIAMMAGSARDIPFLRKNAKGFELGVTAMPAAAHGKNRLGLSGIYAGISGSCTQPDEAWAFLAFIAGKSQILARTLEAVPGCIPSAFPAEYIANDPLLSKAWAIFEAAETVDHNGIFSGGNMPLYGEAESLIREKLLETLQKSE